MRTVNLCLLAMLLASASASANDQPNLNWLAGAWCGANGDGSIEEHWLPERGGLMLGLNRTVAKKGTTFEFLRIEFNSDGARYVAQPGGKTSTSFALVSAAPNTVTFANPQHDFPKRIRYIRNGDSLSARVDGGGAEGADALEFRWKRCRQT